MTDDRRIRVFVVDDHPLVREGIARLVESQPDLELSGSAGGIAEAIPALVASGADVAVVDLSLGDGRGCDLIRRLRDERPELRPLVVSIQGDRGTIRCALRAGAAGYILKQEATDLILVGLRRVAAGETYLSPCAVQALAEEEIDAAGLTSGQVDELLTRRESEIFRLLGEGLRNAEIAKTLCLSPKTVDAHKDNMKRKFGFASVTELVAFAAKRGRDGI